MMVDVQQKIFDIFDNIGYTYFRQGSLGDDEQYPPSFFTFWNLDSPFSDYGDNRFNSVTTDYYIYFYTNDPSILHSTLLNFIVQAKAEGFIVSGNGSDAQSDDKSFVGRMVRITYKDNL